MDEQPPSLLRRAYDCAQIHLEVHVVVLRAPTGADVDADSAAAARLLLSCLVDVCHTSRSESGRVL